MARPWSGPTGQTGAVTGQGLPQAPAQSGLGAPPADFGLDLDCADDPLIAPDGDHSCSPADPNAGEPIDLSTLAGGGVLAPVDPMVGRTSLGTDPNVGIVTPVDPGLACRTQMVGLPQAPTSLSARRGSTTSPTAMS